MDQRNLRAEIQARTRGRTRRNRLSKPVSILIAILAIVAVLFAGRAIAAGFIGNDASLPSIIADKTEASSAKVFTDEAMYFYPNSNAPTPDFPDSRWPEANPKPNNSPYKGSGTTLGNVPGQAGFGDVIELDGFAWHTVSYIDSQNYRGSATDRGNANGFWVSTTTSKNDHARGSVTIRYPSAGYLIPSNTWSEGENGVTGLLTDLYVKFSILKSGGADDTSCVCWGPANTSGGLIQFGRGFWVDNAPLYKCEYWFAPAGTGKPGVASADVNIIRANTPMTYWERSMNLGEGFMLPASDVKEFELANDLPWAWLQGENDKGINFKARTVNLGGKMLDYNNGTNVTPVSGTNGGSYAGWAGFIGAVPSTAHTAGNVQFVVEGPHSPFITSTSKGMFIQGCDTAGFANPVILHGDDDPKGGDNLPYWDQSLWMGAKAEVNQGTNGKLAVIGMALPDSERTDYANGVYANGSVLGTPGNWGGIETLYFNDVYASNIVGGYAGWKTTGGSPLTLNTSRWYVPELRISTASTPPKPEKEVDKQVTTIGDTLTYQVKQSVNKRGYNAIEDFKYESMTFTDTIPTGLSFKTDSFRVLDPDGLDVTDQGTFSLLESNRKIQWSAKTSYLTGDSFKMNGGKYTFQFQATVDSMPTSKKYVNKGIVTINDATLESNEVTTIIETGNLKINKAIEGPDTSAATTFSCTVTLKDKKGNNLSGTFGSTTFSNGTATISVSKNSPVTIEGIPEGSTYTVEEAADAKYIISYDNASGSIVSGKTAEATVRNVRKVGNLTVKKSVSGGGGSGQSFEFEITLKNGNTNYSGTIDGHTFTNGKTTVSVTTTNPVTIHGIPTGYTYEVVEKATGDATQYVASYDDNKTGTIA